MSFSIHSNLFLNDESEYLLTSSQLSCSQIFQNFSKEACNPLTLFSLVLGGAVARSVELTCLKFFSPSSISSFSRFAPQLASLTGITAEGAAFAGIPMIPGGGNLSESGIGTGHGTLVIGLSRFVGRYTHASLVLNWFAQDCAVMSVDFTFETLQLREVQNFGMGERWLHARAVAFQMHISGAICNSVPSIAVNRASFEIAKQNFKTSLKSSNPFLFPVRELATDQKITFPESAWMEMDESAPHRKPQVFFTTGTGEKASGRKLKFEDFSTDPVLLKEEVTQLAMEVSEGLVSKRDQKLFSQMYGLLVDREFRSRVNSLSGKRQKLELMKALDASDYIDEIDFMEREIELLERKGLLGVQKPFTELRMNIQQTGSLSYHDLIRLACFYNYIVRNEHLLRRDELIPSVILQNDFSSHYNIDFAFPYRLFIPTHRHPSLFNMAKACSIRIFYGEVLAPDTLAFFDGGFGRPGYEIFGHDINHYLDSVRENNSLPTPEQVIQHLLDLHEVRSFISELKERTKDSDLDSKLVLVPLFHLSHENQLKNIAPYQTLSSWLKIHKASPKQFHERIHSRRYFAETPDDMGPDFEEYLDQITLERVQGAVDLFYEVLQKHVP